MNDYINYDYCTMEDVAASIKKCVDVFVDIQEQMDTIITSLKEAIVGTAKNAFEEGHALVKGKYKTIQETTQQFANELQKIIEQEMICVEPSPAVNVLSYF